MFITQQVIDLNKLIVWKLCPLLAIFMIIMVLRFKGKRKRILANQIPGTDGAFLIGFLPLLLDGPEKLIEHAAKLYHT